MNALPELIVLGRCWLRWEQRVQSMVRVIQGTTEINWHPYVTQVGWSSLLFLQYDGDVDLQSSVTTCRPIINEQIWMNLLTADNNNSVTCLLLLNFG